MSIVGKRFCNSTLKPNEKKLCNNTLCPAEWFITQWKPCSRTCGGGTQTRKIVCRRKKMNSWIVENDSACVGPKPVEPVLARCNVLMCPFEYLPLAWSECSTSCGEGTSTRELKCQTINENGFVRYVEKQFCNTSGSPKPQTTRRCNHNISCSDKALNYVWIGCFRDWKDSRRLPVVLENLRRKIDWHNPSATIDECAILASKKRKKYFAIQYYGECRTYEDGNLLNYTLFGVSHNYWAGLGGSWTNCVYEFQ